MKKFTPLLIVLLFLSSCIHRPKPSVRIYKAYPYQNKYFIKYTEVGYASWYGKKFQGRPTASGEIFDMYKLTAAHRRLPLGTYVKVTNLSNGKSVIVKINDRGPYVKGRIIDLSYLAAKKIGMVKAGVAKVKIETVRLPYYIRKYKNIFAYRKIYSVQIGAFILKDNAYSLKNYIRKIGYRSFIRIAKVNGKIFYRVYAGKCYFKKCAYKILKRLEKRGVDGFVVEIDE